MVRPPMWRALTILSLVLASLSFALAPYLYKRSADNRSAITANVEENRSTVCSIGSFLTGAPILRVHGVSRQVFIGQLVTTKKFLKDLRSLDCATSTFGRAITTTDIKAQLRRLRHAIEDARGRPQTEGATDARSNTPTPGDDTPAPGQAEPTGPEPSSPGASDGGSSGDGGDGGSEQTPPTQPPPEPPTNPQPPAPAQPSGVQGIVEGVGETVHATCNAVNSLGLPIQVPC